MQLTEEILHHPEPLDSADLEEFEALKLSLNPMDRKPWGLPWTSKGL